MEQWQIKQQIIAEIHNKVDTFGFIKTGGILQAGEIEQPIETERDSKASCEDDGF